MAISEPAPAPARVAGPRESNRRPWRRLLVVLQVAQVRLRFILVLVVAFLVVGKWDTLRSYWDVLLRLGNPPAASKAISSDTEYFCPMCPGVLSEWPTKCPVCFMSLVRRAKGDMVPLPDGVVARMQLSPYRLQLAGIHTSPLTYEPLAHEVHTGGFIEPASPTSEAHPGPNAVSVKTDVFEKDLPFLSVGQTVEVTSQSSPGQSWVGTIGTLNARSGKAFGPLQMVVQVSNPRQELRPGMFVAIRARMPLARQEAFARLALQEWQQRTLLEVLSRAFAAPAVAVDEWGLVGLFRAIQKQVLLRQGLLLAIPESAVVDTGRQKVAYVETAPGMFDGMEVRLGQRCGGHYPVLGGVEFGQRVATTGAFLLDAEARLNPSLAAGYFGASRSREADQAAGNSEQAAIEQALARLSPGDRKLADQQQTCPVTGGQLGSMGTPVRILVDGKVVLLCCKACEPAIRKSPAKYVK